MEQIEPAELPTRAALQPTGLYLELREIEPAQLQDPFMQQTIQRVTARQSIVHILKEDLGKVSPGSAPVGLIFHVGRCGSTLASQLLKLHEQAVVYSEPLPINDILVPPHKWDRDERVLALRTLGDCLARHARKPYVLKLSSWNTLYCDIIADAFPSTPWAFCIRDPVEVCVSLLQQRPGWLRDAGTPSHLFSGVVDPEQSCRTPEEYVAQLFAEYCKAISKLEPHRGKLIRYESLPATIWNTLAPHFGISIDEQVKAKMSAASRTYSKSPVGTVRAFEADDSKKRAATSPELRQAVETFSRPELKRLLASFGQ